MRSKVEWRTCGCGAQIGLRESCARCAAVARARLHEAGIATMRGQENCGHPEERWHRHTDTCGLCGIALRKVRMATMQKRWEAEGAVKALFRYLALFEPHRRALHFQVSFVSRDYAIAARADRHANKWKWPIGADEVAMYTPELHVSLQRSADRLNELVETGVLKLSEVNKAAKHEPPAVGAEVDYSTALADMQRRPEARYRERPEASGVTYWRDGCQWYDTGHDSWHCQNGESENFGFTWTRLPDASTLPAIGAEVTWEQAKADMMTRQEARYRTKSECPDDEYAWSNVPAGVLVYREVRDGVAGTWTVARRDKAAGHRWVRLA